MKNNIILLAFVLYSSSCQNAQAPKEVQAVEVQSNIIKMNASQLQNSHLGFGTIKQMTIASLLKVNGKIDVPPQNMVSISVPLGGYLKTTNMLPGMHIRKGEVLAVIEDQQYIQLQQDYLTTQNKLRYSQLEYERQLSLNENKASSDKVLQQASSERNTLKIELKGLAEKLKLISINPDQLSPESITRSIKIYAPINGYVSKVNVNIGKYVAPTDVMFELVNPEDIHLALNVFEKDLNKLYLGQKLVAYTNNDKSKKYPCAIILIGKDLGADHSTQVHCHFESYDKTLIPGTYMNADIEVKSANSYVLPEEAIVRFENKHYVFVQQAEGQFEMTEIETGNSENGFIALLNGQALASKTIVIKGAYTLLMSLKNKSED